jgi:nucleotide-binding universal stress UspA family protein
MGKRSILVPVDFDEGSANALAFAKELAGPLDAEVSLVHVFTPPVFGYPDMPPAMIEQWLREGRAAAQRALDQFVAAHGGVAAELFEGSPAATLAAVIEQKRPYLVVMATHARRGIPRLVLGSITEQVLRRSVAPVVTVHLSP